MLFLLSQPPANTLTLKNKLLYSISIFFLALLINLLLSFSAQAEDKAIIVFDASGSMWGQLEGKTKIAIAKKTLEDVVTDWNEEKQLGLLAYGHRRKGDCKDIETLVPVSKINKSSMIAKVNKINPKGKTPISASIRMAADELKFTEDNATVILISDGKETCNADPCETAAELEKLGVNFTAHVIGFGVDKKTSEQLQCIAKNTGGLYFPADNAEQLNDALKQVVEADKLITVRAMDEKKGGIFHKIIDWKLINQETEEVISLNGTGAGVEVSLVADQTNVNTTETDIEQTITAGKWLVSGTSGNYSGEAIVEIKNENQLIKIDFNKQLAKVSINAPEEAIIGTELEISWEAPKELKGLLNLQISDEKPIYHSSPLVYTKDKSETIMRLPSVAGDYVLRFYDNEDRMVLAEHPLKIKQAEIKITAPEEAGTGTEIDLSWVAPKDAEAKINLELVGDKPKFHTNPHLYINNNKKEGVMKIPTTAGDYVLRWYSQSDKKVLTEKPIKIIESVVTLNAPDTAETGTEIDLSWEAPKSTKARINLELADEKPKYHSKPNLHFDGKKQEGIIRLPSIAGDYVLRWYNQSDQKVVTEKPIKLTETVITLNAPEQAEAGTEIDLSWEAPKSTKARINLEIAGEKPKYHTNPKIHFEGTKKQAVMRMPSTAGDYILRWYNQSDQKVITERPIKLIEQTINITAPETAMAGSEIEISWDAAKGLDSFINIQLADEKPNYNAKPYIYTKKNTSDYMRMPSEAGDYVLRWYNRGHQKPIAEHPIKLKAAEIIIEAQDETKTGYEFKISWQAPKDLDSFINIQPSGEKPNYNAKPYFYTKEKQSEYMTMPEEPGEYILRWYNRDVTKALAEKKITINLDE